MKWSRKGRKSIEKEEEEEEAKSNTQPGPDQVLIKLNTTGLCMSDIHFMTNDWAMPKMSVFGVKCAGHEGAGVIVKLGSNVKTLKLGQRAGLKPVADVCHTCDLCKAGMDNVSSFFLSFFSLSSSLLLFGDGE